MKLTSLSKPLIAALDKACLVIPAKKTFPILTCVHVSCAQDQAVVTADSLDARISIKVDGVTADEPFEFVASPRFLKSALRGEEAEIVLKDSRLTIKSWGETRISTAELEAFPKETKSFSMAPIDPKQFLEAVKATAYCADPKPDSKYHSMRWHAETQTMYVAYASGMLSVPVELPTSRSFILPSAHQSIINSAFEKDQGLSFGHGEGAILLQSESITLRLNLYEGQIPNWSSLVSTSDPFASVGREALVRALEAVGDFTDMETHRITLSPLESGWKVSSASLDGESEVILDDVKVFDEGLTGPITIGKEFFLRPIKFWTCERISMSGEHSVTLKPEDQSGQIAVVSLIRTP